MNVVKLCGSELAVDDQDNPHLKRSVIQSFNSLSSILLKVALNGKVKEKHQVESTLV